VKLLQQSGVKNDSGSSGATIIRAMGTGVFTALAVVLFTASTTAQSVPLTIPRADHVVVFKHERKLELLSHGKVTKTYKVALGGAPLGPKTRQEITRPPKACMFWTSAMLIANSINLSTFRIPVRAIAPLPCRRAYRPEEVSLFTDCPMATVL
jgi:hypothetical protein